MPGLEAGAVKLGGKIASLAAKSWLRRRNAKAERSADLDELAAAELAGPLERRKLDNLVQNIGTQVAEQLAPVLDTRFSALPVNEVTAALLAVEDTLGKVDLSGDALLADDADPERLAARVRDQFPDHATKIELAPKAAALYELALDQSCRHLVQVVRHLPSFAPRALGEALGRLTQQSAQLDELLARTPKTSLRAPTGTDHDAEFRSEYLRVLAHKLDRLELLGLTMDDQPALPLSVAYISLSVSSTIDDPRFGHRTRKPLDVDWFEGERDGSTATMRVEAAIGSYPYTLVRGEAGSGKTTLLDWLAVTAARGGFTGALEDWNGCVPFPIRLRRFASGALPRPEEFVAQVTPGLAGQMPSQWAHRMLLDGTAMVLVDGIDEVTANRRREVKEWLQDLVHTFPGARFVVASRTAAADQDWLHAERFRSVLLEPMSSGDIQALVRRWHQAAAAGGSLRDDEDLSAVERGLLNQFDSRPHIRALAASPLLCAMLCALNLAHRSELPRDRMDLYRKAMGMLLHLRDAERRISGLLSESQKLILLGDLAWRLTLANKVELSRDKAREHIARRLPSMPNADSDADAVLEHLLERSGVLRAPVVDTVAFVHRTFQEYLAASEATEHDYIDALVSHAHLDTWRETVVMASGHAKHHQAGELLTGILDRSEREPQQARQLRLLATACLETVRNVDPTIIDRIETMVRNHLVPPRSRDEATSLASIGHKILGYLPATLHDLSDDAAAAVTRTAALTASTEALTLLRAYARDTRYEVQRQIVDAWPYFAPERYAAEVLAEAPLLDGNIRVTTTRLLPLAAQLPNITGISISIFSDDEIENLSFSRRDLPIKRISGIFTRATSVDLEQLADFTPLESINLMRAIRYSNISALAALPHLNSLSLSRFSAWHNIDSFAALGQLYKLDLNSMQRMTDIDALTELSSLRVLRLDSCRAQALVTGTPFSNLLDLRASAENSTPLSSSDLAIRFPKLRSLDLSGFRCESLAPLSALPLKQIQLADSPVPDLTPLASSGIEQLLISHPEGPIDLTPLRGSDVSIVLMRAHEVRGMDDVQGQVTVIGS